METLRMIGPIVVGGLGILLFAGWLGLQIKSAPFPAFPQRQPKLETVPLPQGLPAPVERFYRKIYGENIPIIKSAVITGRAEVRPVGPITFPARFRFTHNAGKGYRHYIEATVFGLPLMRVNERYLDGRARGETPFGVDEGEKIDQGAVIWMDDGKPWAVFHVEDIVYNVDVQEYIRAKGP